MKTIKTSYQTENGIELVDLIIDRLFEYNGYYFAQGKIYKNNLFLPVRITELKSGLSIGDSYKDMPINTFLTKIDDVLKHRHDVTNENIHDIISSFKISPLRDHLKKITAISDSDLIKKIIKKGYTVDKNVLLHIRRFNGIKWTRSDNGTYIGKVGKCRLELLDIVVKGCKLFSRVRGREFHKTFRKSYARKKKANKVKGVKIINAMNKKKKQKAIKQAIRQSKKERAKVEAQLLHDTILNCINKGLKYNYICKKYNIKDYKPYRDVYSDKWERVTIIK
jgi:hypothetical protein